MIKIIWTKNQKISQQAPSLGSDGTYAAILNPFCLMLSNCSLSTTGWIPCFSKILAANLALPPVLQFTTSYESPLIARNLSTSLIYFINIGKEISKLYSKVPESYHSFIFLTSKWTYFFFLSSSSMVFS